MNSVDQTNITQLHGTHCEAGSLLSTKWMTVVDEDAEISSLLQVSWLGSRGEVNRYQQNVT